MQPVVIHHQNSQGDRFEASFLPLRGMNMVSFKKNDFEYIDQSTKDLYQHRYAGLGALIGPHFHWKNADVAVKLVDEFLFPHISVMRERGCPDPFAHGIARYAPWKYESTPSSISASLNGNDLWRGSKLSSLEGQNFSMNYKARLSDTGLTLDISIVSDTDSMVGIHYYWLLPNRSGKVISRIRKDSSGKTPPHWSFDSSQNVVIDLAEACDDTMHPENPLRGDISLVADPVRLHFTYHSDNQENCWQLYHPKDASFVCIEPMSCQYPRNPILTVSQISINILPE